MGNLAKGDDDLRNPLRQAFARAQIKGSASPTPIPDLYLKPYEGFGFGVLVADFFGIARYRASLAGARAILSAHGQRRGITGVDRYQRLQNLELFVAHRIRVQGGGRFHGDKAQQLQQMILDHVAQRPRVFVIRSAAPDAYRFSDRDLDMIDMG